MTREELKVAQALQELCKIGSTYADTIDPPRTSGGHVAVLDSCVLSAAVCFYKITGHQVSEVPQIDLDPDNPAVWAKNRKAWS